MPNEPAQEKEDDASQKNGKTRRISPGLVDVLADVEQWPEKKRASTEVLNDLGGLVRDGEQTFAFCGVGKVVKFRLREAEPFG